MRSRKDVWAVGGGEDMVGEEGEEDESWEMIVVYAYYKS